MDVQRWQRVQGLVEAAAILSPTERTEFLDLEAGEDVALRGQVEEMLAAWQDSGVFEDLIARAAAHAVTVDLLEAGDRLGPWRVLRLIGHGGMGSVYQAERADGQFQQLAAIKLVRIGPGAHEELLLRFRAERQILASISHPNIARLLDAGFTDSGLPYLVMEFVEGEPLDRFIKRTNPSLPKRLFLVQQICAAVQHAHQNLIVHRDLKPGNILVTPEATPKLLDFGIAKLLGETAFGDVAQTRPTSRLMTPEYASPEQIRGDAITTATDVYSLGVVLYEVLTLTRPFLLANLSPAEMERVVTETDPLPPSATSEGASTWRFRMLVRRARTSDLDRIVLKSMHKVPMRRYSSVSDLSIDLQRYLDGFPVVARPDSIAYRARLFIGRHRWAVSASVFLFLTIVLLSITSIVLGVRARREAASADSVSSFLTDLFKQARPDSTRGQTVSARELLDQGAARLRASPIQDPLIRARLLSTLGRVYFDLGDMPDAASLLNQAESLYKQHPGEARLQVAETENDLGILEVDRNPVTAEDHLRQALTLYQHVRGPNSSEVADVLDSLAETEVTLGHFANAQRFFEQSLQIDVRNLGPDAAPTLVVKHNLASLYNRLGDYSREQTLSEEVLAADRRTVGNLQEITTSDLGNLAWLEDRLGHFDRAETLSYEAIDLKSKLFGENNPRLAMQFLVLGDIQRQTGRLEQARVTLQKSLALARQFEGSTSLHTAWDQDELGLVDLAEGHLPEARTELLDAMHIRNSPSSPSLQDLALSYDHFGQLELAEQQPITAEQDLRHALTLEHTIFIHANDSVASTENHLAEVLTTLGRLPEACALLRDSEQIAKTTFHGQPHPILAAAQAGLKSDHCS